MVRCDIAIIGAGPAGYVAAIKAAQRGASVFVIEKERTGGVCLNRGCIPTKSLVASAAAFESIRKANEFGIKIEGNVYFSMKDAISRKERIVSILSNGIERLFKQNGINLIRGEGKVLGKGRVLVNVDGEEMEVTCRSIIICTGSSPVNLPGLEIDGKKIISGDQAVSLEYLPERVLIVGAGVIGCEYAMIFNMLGCRVTAVEIMERVLPFEDEDISRILEREMRKRKIDLHLKSKVESVEKGEEGIRAYLSDGKAVEADIIIVSVGRAPNSSMLGLEEIGVDMDGKGFVRVNECMETDVKGIYAAGDVVGGLMLAHVASTEGIVAAVNATGGRTRMDYSVVPVGIFTSPDIGRIGLTEKQAREAGYNVQIGRFPFRALGKSHASGEIAGEVKIIGDGVSGRIIGAHIIGPHAVDLVHEVAVAMRAGLHIRDIAETIHAHPCFSEALMEAAHDFYGNSVHLPPRGKTS